MAERLARGSAHHRRRRAVPRLATVLQVVASLLGLGALLWGADAAVRVGAESLLARNLQASTGVSDRPEVELHGTFVLPQVIRGSYGSVDVSMQGIVTGPLRVERVDAQLEDVRIPFHDVLVRDLREVGVGRASSVVTLTYGDLSSYLRETGRPLTLSAADDDTVRVSGTVDLLDQRVDAAAVVALSAGRDGVRVTPTQVEGIGALDPLDRLLLGQRLTFTVPLDTLPFGLQVTEVAPDATHVVVRVQGSRLVVDP
ncbi:DUF2993 domain-containing protein [Desertihabitans brevis]|uniref:DUF2993 domain-containing protein n=1 Tax=Desertihabitans brevis TaxID=2268447 RepID=A0A367YS49_9ACTN|nr:DUF2993 domain-containing protein [Desertihabitans brevis]RCK68620.1 DUF2993 domain-containing protein [Desertihabitans brevis]